MRRYERLNNMKIDRLFARVPLLQDADIQKLLVKAMKDAVDYALKHHDASHRMHLVIGDTYGWVLVHNGVQVAKEVYAGKRDAQGKADSLLDAAAQKAPRAGWVGIVLAGMEPANWFEQSFEVDILLQTARHTAAFISKNFNKAKY